MNFIWTGTSRLVHEDPTALSEPTQISRAFHATPDKQLIWEKSNVRQFGHALFVA